MASSATAGAILGAAVSWTTAGGAGGDQRERLVRRLEGLHRGRGGGPVSGRGSFVVMPSPVGRPGPVIDPVLRDDPRAGHPRFGAVREGWFRRGGGV